MIPNKNRMYKMMKMLWQLNYDQELEQRPRVFSKIQLKYEEYEKIS